MRCGRTGPWCTEKKAGCIGDPSLVQLAATQPALRQQAVEDSAPSALDVVSRLLGLAGLAGLVLTRSRTSAV